MLVLVFKGTAYFRDLTFHLADCQVQPTGTCPIDEKQLFKTTKKKLRGLSPQANYTDRAAAAGRRS